MERSIILTGTLLAALAGCAALQNAGNSSYSIKPFVTDAGATICCAVDIRDGKERAALDLAVSKHGDNYTLALKEQGVAAFAGQAVTAGALQTAIGEAVKAAIQGYFAPRAADQ